MKDLAQQQRDAVRRIEEICGILEGREDGESRHLGADLLSAVAELDEIARRLGSEVGANEGELVPVRVHRPRDPRLVLRRDARRER
jgi:hypothetical protein